MLACPALPRAHTCYVVPLGVLWSSWLKGRFNQGKWGSCLQHLLKAFRHSVSFLRVFLRTCVL